MRIFGRGMFARRSRIAQNRQLAHFIHSLRALASTSCGLSPVI